MKDIQSKTGAAALLAQTPLFADTDPANADWVLRSPLCTYAVFDAGEVLYDAEHFPRAVTVLVSGAANCYSLSGEHAQPVLLNRFLPGDLFGLAAVFAPEGPYVSRIVAQKRSKALFLPQELLRALFRRDIDVTERYIAYLSGRVNYLNRKIAGFTAGEAENRVAVYLAQQRVRSGDAFELPCSVSALCSILGLGRASVYRAFDRLTASGALERTGRQIRILHADTLARFCH